MCYPGIGYNSLIFTVIECWLSLVCASAPALKGFIEAYIVPTVANKSQGITSKLATFSDRITPFASKHDANFKAGARRGSDVELVLPKEKLDIAVHTRFSMTSDGGHREEDFEDSEMQLPLQRF